jgi:hypothetical protein
MVKRFQAMDIPFFEAFDDLEKAARCGPCQYIFTSAPQLNALVFRGIA